MKKSRIIALSLSLIMIVAACFSLTVSTSAADSDWISTGNSSKEYAYSMAVIGDTQSLSISDAKNYDTEAKAYKDGYEPRVEKLYKWIVDNAGKDKKNIQLVMGLGDIVETWQSRQDWPADKYSQYWDLQDLEWNLIKPNIGKLADANIPFTLVRGNHDSDKAFNQEIKAFTKYTDQLTKRGDFYKDSNGNVKYDTSYMMLELGEAKKTKWLVIQLDWAVTTAELDWAAGLIKDHPDHQVILTMHNYLYRDATIDGKTGSASTAVPNKNWDYSIDPTSPDLDPNLTFNPDGIWHRLVSKYENIKLVLCGHDTSSDLKVSQLIGDNDNTVTQMLVDPQAMDLDTANPGGVGMVCMLYFREDGSLVNSWDEKNIDVEWYSTIRASKGETNVFYKASNQFTIDVKYYDGGTDTKEEYGYGVIPAEYANAEEYPFVAFAHDIDVNEYFFIGAYENWTTSAGGGAYPSLSNYSGKNGLEIVILLRRNFDTANDSSYANFGNLGLTLNLDLGGHQFIMSKNIAMFQTNLKKNVKTNIRVYGKEGSAILNGTSSSAIVTLGVANTNANGAEFTYTFDGIDIGFASGAATSSLVAKTFQNAVNHNTYVHQNLSFNDCTFNLVDNKPDDAVNMFLLNETESETIGRAIASVDINGGEIKASDISSVNVVSMNANDRFSYNADSNGEYVTFNLSESSAAPAVYKTKDNKTLERVNLSNGKYTFARAKQAESGSLGTIDVWLIGGQSNASGYGSDGLTDAKYDSRYTTGFDNILYYGSGDGNVKTEFVPLTVGLGKNSTSVGAEVGIAKMLGDSDTMNAVIKLGRGSSYLYPNTDATVSINYGTWTSPTYLMNNKVGTVGTKVGALYTDFIAMIAEAIDILEMRGYTPVIRGMWWMQGEAECNNATLAAAYEELLTCLINDLRADIEENTGIETSDMPFVAGNIYRNGTKDENGNYIYTQPAYIPNINAAQAKVAEELNNVYTVATAGLAQVDKWHFTADAQQYLGEQFVKAVVYSEGKYNVYLDAIGSEGTGFGSYREGDSVTVTITAIDGYVLNKVYYTVSGSEPVELTVAGGVCTYTFTMPASDVVFTAEANDPNSESTPYGKIPTKYTDGTTYPFIIFKNGEFVTTYDTWYDAVTAAGNMATDKNDVVTVLLRSNFTNPTGESVKSVNTYNMVAGTLVIDLNNTILTSYHELLQFNHYYNYTSNVTIKNGTIVVAGRRLANLMNQAATANQVLNLTFDNLRINFNVAKWSLIGTSDKADLKGLGIANVVFNNCTIDLGELESVSSNVLIKAGADENSSHVTHVVFKGGEILSNEDFTGNLITRKTGYTGGEADTLKFEKNSDGEYTKFTMPSTVTTISGNIYDSKHLAYESSTADGNITYQLVEIPYVEGYGYIDSKYYDIQKYPFLLFQNGVNVKGYEKYSDFIVDAAIVTVDSTLYLRRDYDTTNDSYPSSGNKDRYLYNLKAKLTIDLGGHSFTRSSTFKNHLVQAYGTNGKTIVINIEIKNGTVIANNYLVYFNNHYGQDTSVPPEETFNITFSNVTLVAGSAGNFINIGGNGNGSYGNIVFNDCTFDLQSAKSTFVPFELAGSNALVDINVVINGGTVKSNAQISKLANLSNSGDSVKFGKSTSTGAYVSFVLPKDTAAPSLTFACTDSTKSLSLALVSNDINATYQLGEDVYVNGYGCIPYTYASYTFVILDANKTAFAGYNTWYEIWKNIWTLRKTDNITVLMLKDYNTDNCADSSQDVFAAKNMVIDLNGHTLTRGSKHIFQLYEKGKSAATYIPNITVKNGTIYAKSGLSPLYFNGSPSAVGIDVKFTFVFENVTFTSADNYSNPLVVNSLGNGVNGVKADLRFNGCSFIVKENIPSIFALNEEGNKHATNVVINGGSITLGKNASIVLLNSNDSFKFGKLEGGAYTSLLVKSGVSAPTDAFITDSGVECVFVKISEKDGYVSYTLRPEAIARYKIQTSVTLWSNFVYNVYIPTANVKSFTVNGNSVEYTTETIDGVEYYCVAVNLPAGNALSDIKVKVTLEAGDSEITMSWTLNVLKYAKSILASNAAATVKTLMRDMLAYASAAHTYFENTTAVADKLAEVNTMLTGYSSAMPDGEAVNTTTQTYFKEVAIYLGEVPSFRFYLNGSYTADDFTFTAGGKNVSATLGNDNDNKGDYLEIKMYAYMMLDTVSYTVSETGEAVTESYNLYDYYAYITALSAADSGNTEYANAKLLVEALIKYSDSAAAYRRAVIGV